MPLRPNATLEQLLARVTEAVTSKAMREQRPEGREREAIAGSEHASVASLPCHCRKPEPCGFESLELARALPQSCQAQDVAALLSGGGTL